MLKKVIFAVVILLGLLIILGLFFPLSMDHHPAQVSQVVREISSIAIAAKAYHLEYGFSPTGSPVQIAAALSGQNPKKIVFIEMPGKSIGSDGQFIDPWGMPYSIVFSSESNVVVRSAGKDRTFKTGDDIESEGFGGQAGRDRNVAPTN
jgi:hypothetical protein